MTDLRVWHADGLRGQPLRRMAYRLYRRGWDHDHCAACWATFALEDGPDIQREGFATTDAYELGAEYEWVCIRCFEELKQEMGWYQAPADA